MERFFNPIRRTNPSSAEGKEKVIIYDYVDYSLPMLERMFRKRLRGYEALGYTITEPGQDAGLVQAHFLAENRRRPDK